MNQNKYLSFVSEYDKEPKTFVKGNGFVGHPAIAETIAKRFSSAPIIVLEKYPGIRQETLRRLAEAIASKIGAVAFDVEEAAKDESEIQEMIQNNLTDDRVFGVMSHFHVEDFYDEKKLENLKANLPSKAVVYGFGASLVSEENVVYVELDRWEMQLRFRNKETNWHASNENEDPLKKFKRGYFVEWRAADRLKKKLLRNTAFYIDGNDDTAWKMVETKDLMEALHVLAYRPFRLVPYFDPGVWGGQWMKEVCHLDPSKKNYAWSFDGVPEENALHFDFNGMVLSTPASNLTFFEPKALLGTRAYGRFGDEFPIRFDFLDTMGGGNLSLQCHPLTQYIQDKFGMHYTQDESYYLLDAGEDAVVYLGLKEGVDKEAMIRDLKHAQETGEEFPADLYVNHFPAKKHDHFLIPAGTVHCSGKDSMVLEISATPYIFTFKLYDWGRIGLDGKPRPIHIDHGANNIQFDRTTQWVKDNLINHFETKEDGWVKTGLHEAEFVETRRKFFSSRIEVNTHGSVNMNNLVEGRAARIISKDGSFEDYVIHYAETFIVPSTVESYFIEPVYEGETVGLIQAYVR